MKFSRKKSLLILTFILFWGFTINLKANSVPDSLASPNFYGLTYNSSKLETFKKFYIHEMKKAKEDKNQYNIILSKLYLAKIYRYERKHDSSKHYIDRANFLINDSNQTDSTLLSLYHKAKSSNLFFYQEYEKMNHHLDSAYRLASKLKYDSSYISEILYLKYIVHNLSKRYDSASYYLTTSINESPVSQRDSIKYKYLRSLCRLYKNIGDLKKVETTLYQSLLNCDPNKPIQKSRTYHSLGKHYIEANDYEKSLHYFKLNLEHDSTHNILSPTYKSELLFEIASVYSQQSKYQKSISYLKKAISILNDKPTKQLIENYNSLGRIYILTDSIQKARSILKKSVKLSKRLSKGQNLFQKAFALIYLGDLELNHLHNMEGISLVQEGIDLLKKEEGKNTFLLRYPYNILFNAYLNLHHDFETALEYLNKAHQLNHRTNFKDNLDEIKPNNYIDYQSALADLGRYIRLYSKWISFETDKNKLEYLYTLLYNAIINYSKTSDLLRKNIINTESKLTKTALNKSSFYYIFKSIELLYNETGNKKYLFDFFKLTSQIKAITLHEQQNENKAKYSLLPDSIINQENNYKKKIGSIKELIHIELSKENHDKSLIHDWENSLNDLITKNDQLVHNIKFNFPEYYQLKHGKHYITIDEVQSNLSEDQALLEFNVLNDSSIFIFGLTKHDFKFIPVDNGQIIFNNLDTLLNITNIADYRSLNSMQLEEFKSSSNYLYSKLIQPISELAKGKKLIINPDDKLWYLPFEILLTDSAKNIKNFRSLPYLIKDHPISYAYSTKLYFDKDENRKPNPRNVLSIVPSYDASINYIDELLEENTKRDQLRPLPNSIKEAEYVNKALGGKLLKGNDASEKNFKNLADKYKILHLAMHAVIDNKNPDYSKLIFTHGVDTTEDNYLNTYEIYNKRLNADLAVLSSCNSGSGKMQKGEGIISIARAFLYAGCPSLVTTLWSVDDASSAKLMQYFYENLKDGMSKSVALQQAKLKFVETTSPLQQHPYFWASYTQIGNDEPIQFRSKNKFYYIYVGIILLVVIILSRKKSLLKRFKN